MALHLHRADRTDLLADGLGALLSTPLPDPFAEELVLVSARGMERWLSQRLSHVLGRGTGDEPSREEQTARADGICAGVAFRHPQSLIAELTGMADDDPWSPDAMVWPLLEVIDGCLDEPWCTALATHLGHFEHGGRRNCARGGATPSPAASPACSPPMPGNARSSSSTGSRGVPRPLTRTCSGSPGSTAPSSIASTRTATHPARENHYPTAGVAH